jgi:hypothetical protein
MPALEPSMRFIAINSPNPKLILGGELRRFGFRLLFGIGNSSHLS